MPMANKKVKIICSGVYAVKEGATVELEEGEQMLDAEQAEKLAKSGKVVFIANAKKAKED